MNLTTLTIEGVPVPISVDEQGIFHASVGELDLEHKELARLRGDIADTIVGHRLDVPFYTLGGRRGTMRGFHAGNKDVLVTWADGSKDRMSPHTKVFRPAEVDQTDLDTLTANAKLIGELRAEVDEIQAKGTSDAAGLMAEALGEDLTAWGRHREQVTA